MSQSDDCDGEAGQSQCTPGTPLHRGQNITSFLSRTLGHWLRAAEEEALGMPNKAGSRDPKIPNPRVILYEALLS
jgi:hypothetical protein